MSTARVARLRCVGEPDRFVKTQQPTWDRGLDAEHERLAWLASTSLRRHVPKVVSYERSDGFDRLVTTAVDGEMASELGAVLRDESSRAALSHRVGATLRVVHDTLPVESCPFDMRLDVRLAMAARRVEERVVADGEFEPENEGRTPASVLAELLSTRPAREDLVVTHGDWCFPNVLFGDEVRWGMIDLAGLGVGCRWYDLGIGSRSVAHNLGDAASVRAAFFEGYGVDPDEELVRYYVLLDELQ